jgi:hypothetical protein
MNTALHRNPFYVLGATTRDKASRLIELAEEKALLTDPDVCQKARSDLVSPRSRLAAEMSWLLFGDDLQIVNGSDSGDTPVFVNVAHYRRRVDCLDRGGQRGQNFTSFRYREATRSRVYCRGNEVCPREGRQVISRQQPLGLQ